MNTFPTPKPIGDYLTDFKENMNPHNQGISSGFSCFDKITYGFLNGTLTVIASRPSMGKSALADTMALKVALEKQKSVLYYSIEANKNLITKRLIANISDVKLNSLFTGKLDKEERKKVDMAIKDLSGSSLDIYFKPEVDIDDLCFSHIMNETTKSKFDIIFIDYLQLITTKYEKATNREQEIGYIARKLKSLAKKLNIPIVVLSQLSRGAEFRGGAKKPMLEDLRDSGVIEDVADVICFIHRPEYYGMRVDEDNAPIPKGLAEIIFGKNRHGAIGTIRMTFDKDICKFCNYEDNREISNSIISPADSDSYLSGGYSNAPF
jgi:replicative DNA helicase